MKTMRTMAAGLALLFSTGIAMAQEGGSRSFAPPPIGEHALPKALYIVPWKDAEMGEPLPMPRVNMKDSALAPLDRDTFRQRLWYQSGAMGAVSGER